MEKLTSLQRLGISYLLLDLFRHNDYSITCGGIISFHENKYGEFITMYAKANNGKKYQFTLKNENINTSFIYSFQWDSFEKLFHIIDIDERLGIA